MQYPDDEEIEAIDQYSDRSCASKRDRAEFMASVDPRGSTDASHVEYRQAVYVQVVGGARRDAFWQCFILPRESSVYESAAVLDALGHVACDGNPFRPTYSKGQEASLHAPVPDVFDAVPFDRLDDALDQVRETGIAPYYMESWYRKLKQEERRT